MFTSTEKSMLVAALDVKVASMKLMSSSRPEFKEVADREASAYAALITKVRGLPDETQSVAKK